MHRVERRETMGRQHHAGVAMTISGTDSIRRILSVLVKMTVLSYPSVTSSSQEAHP